MSEENGTSSAIEGAETNAPVTAEPKKQRAPRQKKVAAEVTGSATPAVTAKAPRKKRAEKPVQAAAAAADTSAISESNAGKGRKVVAKAKPVKPAKATVSAPVAVDEFADLIALEEENKSLRKALAEKLRAENADLRKKLGQA